MLSFRLSLADMARGCNQPWRWEGTKWTRGESWIRPVSNPALECFLTEGDEGRVYVVVREALPHRPPARLGAALSGREPATSAPLNWPGEFVFMELEPAVVRLTAGVFGTAPVYLVVPSQGVIEGSWYLPNLRRYVSLDHLLERAILRALTRRHRYSTDTIFSNIHRLTERTTATFRHGGLSIQYPSPALHVVRPRAIRPGGDPVAAFDSMLQDSIRRNLDESFGSVAVELSGGIDSANVALALKDLHGESAYSYGLTMGGEVGADQRSRRKRLLRTLRFADNPIVAEKFPPFVPSGIRGSHTPHQPTGDFYAEAFDAARQAAQEKGTPLLFTGFGGDEIMALRETERRAVAQPPALPPWLGRQKLDGLGDIDTNIAPVAPIPLPSLVAFSARNPLILRRGMWPVSPLVDPALVRLGESLPAPWRRGKLLLRERLRRAGVPEDVVSPRWTESFLPLMRAGLLRNGLPWVEAMLRHSWLIDEGYVSHETLRSTYERAKSSGKISDLLYDTVAVEVGVRSLVE